MSKMRKAGNGHVVGRRERSGRKIEGNQIIQCPTCGQRFKKKRQRKHKCVPVLT